MAKLLSAADIMSRQEYELAREEYRQRVAHLKRPRRIELGATCAAHFENRESMRYQIHEMLRAAGAFGVEEAVTDELHTYNPLITQPDRLCATLMFEFRSETERRASLPRLAGIERHVWLEVGGHPRIAAQFDAPPLDPQQPASVQFVRFPLTKEHRAAIAKAGALLRLVIDHPYYQAHTPLEEETRAALAADLAA